MDQLNEKENDQEAPKYQLLLPKIDLDPAANGSSPHPHPGSQQLERRASGTYSGYELSLDSSTVIR